MIRENNYIATQTDKGFEVFFQNKRKNPVEVTYDDFNEFANRYNKHVAQGEEPELNDREKLMLSIWQMILIPDTTTH